MNQVSLMGRMTKEPILRYHSSENPLAITRFTLAVDRGISKKRKESGEQSVDFINCVTFGNNAEFVERWFRKGMMVGIVGRLQVHSYDDAEGKRHWITEVITDSHFFGGNKRGLDDESS